MGRTCQTEIQSNLLFSTNSSQLINLCMILRIKTLNRLYSEYKVLLSYAKLSYFNDFVKCVIKVNVIDNPHT